MENKIDKSDNMPKPTLNPEQEQFQPVNIPEFQELVRRYETITLKEIESAWQRFNYPYRAKQHLTGFGYSHTCSLCKKTRKDQFEHNPPKYCGGLHLNRRCERCVYAIESGCCCGINEKTYDLIENANTPEDLLSAYRARAEHLRATYPQYLIKKSANYV